MIEIPSEYVELACGWYWGSGSMLYAIASTGNLILGSIRPYDTDDECLLSLYRQLSAELSEISKLNSEDEDQLIEFEKWVDDLIEKMEGEL